jgi:HD domain
METSSFARGESVSNPDFLEALVQASERYSIVASQDIVDVRGLKLWAKGQPVSAALQQRLLERKLMRPLEACLMAEDGVTTATLHDMLESFWAEASPLARALQPWAHEINKQTKSLPLHSVAQLLLTTALATRPDTLPHAMQGMALAGAMQGTDSPTDARMAMLGGLLHDIGEVYIQPQYLDPQHVMDLDGHKHMVVHPRMAQLLLSATTDYPTPLCRAVGEHHERINGAGYPARLSGDGISPLGRLLAVVEVTLGIVRHSPAPLTHASLALRMVPAEFPPRWSTAITNLARTAAEPLPVFTPQADALAHINTALHSALQTASALQHQSPSSPPGAIVALALERLGRMRIAWNALGVWGISSAQLTPIDHYEMHLATHELRLRLRDLQRECMLLAERISEADRDTLQPIWADLLAQHA